MTVLDSRHIAVFGGYMYGATTQQAYNDLYILVVRMRGRKEGEREKGRRKGGREEGRKGKRVEGERGGTETYQRVVGCFVSSR